MKVLALFCVLLIGSAQCSPTKFDDTTSEILLKIITTITDALYDAILLREYAIKDFINNIEVIRLDSVRVLGIHIKFIEDRFQLRVDEATDLDAGTLKYWKCLKDKKDNLNVAVLSYYSDITACAITSLRDLVNLLNPILEDLKDVDQKVAADAAGLADCDDKTCITGILLQIVDDVLSILDVVSANLQALVDALAAFEEVVKKCSVSSFDAFFSDLFNAFSQVAKCAVA